LKTSTKTLPTFVLLAILLGLSGCATSQVSPRASKLTTQADLALAELPGSLPAYNQAVRKLVLDLSKDLATHPQQIGIELEAPPSTLPLHHIEVLPNADPRKLGVPVVLGYETAGAKLYPPEGLFVDATAYYDNTAGRKRIVLTKDPGTISVLGRRYSLDSDPTGASEHLRSRARRLATSGFISMIRPASLTRKPQIYLLEPYDPNKIPLLMVHGLQSTPVAFAALVNALRSDPEIRHRYQIWQFYYASGTPVLANAAALRESLAKTLQTLDPKDRDAATKKIIVLGHSMGGVISHTLVSTSGDHLWASVFRKPPAQLKGDPAAISNLQRILIFQKNPRISRIIFMAAPHRGSPMATSFIGFVGNSLTRLSPMQESGFSRLARENPQAMMPDASTFYDGGRFSAVRTLSPKSPALIALSKLPIPIPYHSVIGQQHPGPVDTGSDGVVPYWSSHLDGADSELIVRSGHGVISNPEAITEVIRILNSDPKSTPPVSKR